MASLSEFAGPFLFGTAVAATIGRDLVQASAITLPILLIAVVSAIVWNSITWYFGLPSSSTHALLGGLAGAVAMTQGIQALRLTGFAFVLLALFSAPVLGLLAGFAFMRLTQYLTRNATPRVNAFFKQVQPLNVVALALSHGSNDGQKSMGLITIALVAASDQKDFVVPFWVTLLCAIAMMLGVSIGGWRVIRTLGGRIYRLRPVHAFAAQSASALIVLGAALLGGPVSTTQVVSAAIIGVGSAERMNAVRWHVAGQIVTAWLVTIPASAFVAILLHLLAVRIAGY
jgi:PiT family inorganic phosphate transporter